MSDVKVAQSRDVSYDPILESASKVRHVRIPLNNINSGTQTLGNASSLNFEWKLGGDYAYNLAKSYIQYTVTAPKGATGTYVWCVNDVVPFATVQFVNAAGVPLLSLQEAQFFTKTVSHATVTRDEAEDNDAGTGDLTAMPYSVYENRYNSYGANTWFYPYAAGGAVVPQSTKEFIHAIRQSAVDTDLKHTRRIPLSVYKNTILGDDKVQYFGTDMYLRIQTELGSRFGYFTSKSATNPTTNYAAFGSDITLTNIYLFLAVEQNEFITNLLKVKHQENQTGDIPSHWTKIDYPVPYTYNASGTTASVAFNINVNSQFGNLLKRIYLTVADDTQTDRYNTSNVDGERVVSYRLYINSNPLSNDKIYCYAKSNANYNSTMTLDWDKNGRYLKGTTLTSQRSYQADAWIDITDFTRGFVKEFEELGFTDSQIEDGLKLSEFTGGVQFGANLDLTAGNGKVFRTYMVFSRKFAIVNGQIVFA